MSETYLNELSSANIPKTPKPRFIEKYHYDNQLLAPRLVSSGPPQQKNMLSKPRLRGFSRVPCTTIERLRTQLSVSRVDRDGFSAYALVVEKSFSAKLSPAVTLLYGVKWKK